MVRFIQEDIQENKSAPQTALDKMQSEIDNYVNKYWEVAASDWESWVDAYEKSSYQVSVAVGERPQKYQAITKLRSMITFQVMFQSLSRYVF